MNPTHHIIGYWPLREDCLDHSGNGRHGTNHGVAMDKGRFSGRGEHITAPSLELGTSDFTLMAAVKMEDNLEDIRGDILSCFDPTARRGFTLGIGASAGGYCSAGDPRQVYFGMDNAILNEWEDCGRPSATSAYVSNSLTVYNGALYAATIDASDVKDWCHVFRYAGGRSWEDCGRVGDRKTHGVGPMIAHQGRLYAATTTYDWTRVESVDGYADCGAVYRYEGGTTWTCVGQPGECRRFFGLASFQGKLYVSAEDGHCYVWDGDENWLPTGSRFPNYAHPLGIHDGRLFAGVLNPAGVWALAGSDWESLGNPQGAEERCNQIHALLSYRDSLHATTWDEGRVCVMEKDRTWTDIGRLGESTEINALCVYNGKLYGGSIPWAEVFRYDGPSAWTCLKRFHEPRQEFQSLQDWARVTSLTVFNGRMYASVGNCTSSVMDSPADYRGSVWSLEAGKSVTYDRDIGPGWRHITVVRRGGALELYLDGHKTVVSSPFNPKQFDLSANVPLRIGSGEGGSFNGCIRDVRAYRSAMSEEDIAAIAMARA